MKITFYLLLFIIVMLLVAETKISMKPFKVSFEKGYYAIGILFLAIGLGLIQYQSYLKGRNKGQDDVIDILKTYQQITNHKP